MVTKYHRLILIIIIIIALLVRFWNFPSFFGFDYDQEINAWIAKAIIVDHKPVLIGPETSVGGMYVGPYFNYIITLGFLLGRMDPMTTIWLNLIFSGLTIGAFFYFGSKIFSPLAGLFAAIIYGFSFLMVNFDRILWNLTPLPLVSLGIVGFLWIYLQKKKFYFLLITSALTALSLHLHFTALFLVAFFTLSLAIWGRRPLWADKRSLLIIIATFAFFLLPLVIFDLRHDFINSRHFGQFFFTGTGNNTPLSMASIWRIMSIYIGFFRAVFYRQLDFSLLTNTIMATLLFGFIAYVLVNFKKSALIYKLVLVFFAIPLFGLSFYHGALPSQYFLPELSLFILVAAAVLASLAKKSLAFKVLVGISLTLFALYNSSQAWGDTNNLALHYKQQAVDMIVADAAGQSFKVDFITDRGLKTGFNYLFWLRGEKLIEDMSLPTKRTYKIVVPYYLVAPRELSAIYGAVGVIKSD
ncbi:MAG: hypothetical protein UY21_C0001G0076 [Microgenomates group bacterium GW2011_GWA1_48_10]|nr:MAG: hypothetical protein UY21_C0001G0076 [Microgenomates group bacterium GW2011_GWA1_48_10]